MPRDGRGWHKESVRHGLAAKGIKTGRQRSSIKANPQSMMQRFYRRYRGKIERLTRRGRKENREWAADLDIQNGELILEDVHWGNEDESYQSWDRDDPKANHGYCHYHVSQALPGLSGHDYIAAIDIHDKKEDKMRPTYIGLATDDRLRIWSYLPKENRRRVLETISEKEDWKALQRLEQEMRQNGEMRKVLDKPLSS